MKRIIKELPTGVKVIHTKVNGVIKLEVQSLKDQKNEI